MMFSYNLHFVFFVAAITSREILCFTAPSSSTPINFDASSPLTSPPTLAGNVHGQHYHQLRSFCLHAHTNTSATSPSQQQQQHSSGRRWKSRRKRQTFLPSPVRAVSKREEEALLDQLGYVPPNVCRVSARSGDASNGAFISKQDGEIHDSTIDTSDNGVGRPISIQSYPLLVQLKQQNKKDNQSTDESETIDYSHEHCNITPFPTLYWLTCPHVSRAISELERQGHVRNFQLKLENDKELASEWWECHEEYALERWNILSEQDREFLSLQDCGDETERKKRLSMREMIQLSGVAGTDHRGLREERGTLDSCDNFVPSVKCLHSHYAHYRSQLSRKDDASAVVYNLVGKWTHELLLEQFPDLIL